jgi:hypothetical protein
MCTPTHSLKLCTYEIVGGGRIIFCPTRFRISILQAGLFPRNTCSCGFCSTQDCPKTSFSDETRCLPLYASCLLGREDTERGGMLTDALKIWTGERWMSPMRRRALSLLHVRMKEVMKTAHRRIHPRISTVESFAAQDFERRGQWAPLLLQREVLSKLV